MTRENQVEKMLDELEEEFAKANMPVNDKLTLFAKVSNIIYKYAEQEPCTDAISRQAMHIELEKWITYGEYKYSNATKYLYDRIDRLPPVKPAEKVGQWIKDESSSIAYRCTVCNTLQHWSVIQQGRYHFCPNCGAKMQEVEE